LSSTTAFIKIGNLIFSFLIGIIFFYITNQSTKQEKKQQINQFMSYLINFILFIWAGKIIIHIQIFFQDPFAVLAYPSDSKSVYIATILLIIQLMYQKVCKQLSVSQLVNTFIPIFLATSFIYEFIALTMMNSKTALQNLLLITVLVLAYLFLHDKLKINYVTSLISFIYCVVHIVFYFIGDYTIVFGYMLHPIYFMSILLLIMYNYIYDQRNST